jgi:hypothetical protein
MYTPYAGAAEMLLHIKVHSTYANILKNIYKKVRKIVGIG